MTINWSKRLSVRDNAKSEIKHFISHYANNKEVQAKFLDLREYLMAKPQSKKQPQYIKTELYVYWDACIEFLVTSQVVYMKQWIDGNFYTIKEMEKLPNFSHRDLAMLHSPSGFFWDSTHPYFVTDYDNNVITTKIL